MLTCLSPVSPPAAPWIIKWGHGQGLVCCLLYHPTYNALSTHPDEGLLDGIRVPPDDEADGFLVPLLEHGEYCLFPSASRLIPFAPRACESGLVFKIGWYSSSPLPLNEGSVEAKASVLWNCYCGVTRDCWAASHAFGFIIRGLYTRAGSLPVFFFPQSSWKQNSSICFERKKELVFANSYEKSRIGPFWNLPTLTVSL